MIHTDNDEFWIIGDFEAKTYAMWGGEGHDCYIETSDPTRAETFSSYQEAKNYLRRDKDMRQWRDSMCDPEYVKPLRVRTTAKVYAPGARV